MVNSKKIIFSVFLFTYYCQSVWVRVDELPTEPITQRSVAIQKRYYYIQRLQNSFSCIKQKYHQLSDHQYQILANYAETLTNIDVVTCLHNFIEEKNIVPLELLWKKIIGFKSVESTDFIFQSSQLFFTILSLLEKSSYQNLSKKNDFSDVLESLENLFEELDDLCSRIVTSKEKSLADQPNAIMAGAIASRFYIVKRLDKANRLLNNAYQDYTIKKPKTFFENVPFIAFKSKTVQKLYFIIKQTSRITPLFDFLQKFQNFRYVNDLDLTKDFLQLYFLFFYEISFASNIKDVATGAIDFSYIINRINELSILELLEAIDLVVQYYETNIPKNNFFFSTLYYCIGY